jgi:hypothetical protein
LEINESKSSEISQNDQSKNSSPKPKLRITRNNTRNTGALSVEKSMISAPKSKLDELI